MTAKRGNVSKMRIILSVINLVALVAAIIWCLLSPDWEPVVTSITLFGALLAQIFTSDKIKSKLNLVQKFKKGSHNYTAAGDQAVTDNKKVQIGEKCSQLIQGDSVTVNYGIDEKRAREICKEMSLQLRKDYSLEALEIASSRVAEFENRLMPKMEAVSGALEAFADPSFQLLLVEAQKTAASTERPADYDLLSELLVHRFQKDENRIVRAGISRAVEIVDKISDDALLGLTVLHAATNFIPVSGDIKQGLNTLNDLFGKIIYGSLPSSGDWLDHLDILDAVRISSLGSLKKIQQLYPERLAGYIEVGIEKTSGDYNKAFEILKSNGLSQNILVDHAFNNNFVRLNITDKKRIPSLKLSQPITYNGKIIFQENPVSEEQIKAINSIYDLYKKDGKIKQQNIKNFMDEWDKHPNLQVLKEWWDNIGSAVQITSVGKVLAHSNAQRCDKNLPPLD